MITVFKFKSCCMVWVFFLLQSATKLGQGNIFRSVCQEFCRGGHAWQGACVAGGMHGRGRAWWACVAWGWVHVWQARTPPADTTRYGQWAGVRILLECILVDHCFRIVCCAAHRGFFIDHCYFHVAGHAACGGVFDWSPLCPGWVQETRWRNAAPEQDQTGTIMPFKEIGGHQ